MKIYKKQMKKVIFLGIHRNASILGFWGLGNFRFMCIWLSKEQFALQLFSLMKESH